MQNWVLLVGLVHFAVQEGENCQERLEEGIESSEGSHLEEETVGRLEGLGEERHSVETGGRAFHGHQGEELLLQDLVEVHQA